MSIRQRLILLALVMGFLTGMANLSFSEVKYPEIMYLAEKKSPESALCWSLLMAGGGQMYNGEIGKGFFMLSSQIFCLAPMFVETSSGTEKLIPISALGFLGIGIWSVVDAYKGANRFNEKLKQKYDLILRIQENKPTLYARYRF